MKLPYPNYTWQFSQHEILLESDTTYKLLGCAAEYEGQPGAGQQISKLINKQKILTENIRDGRSDPWRDYQQILPELGLMFSTKQHRDLKLTRLGRQYLSGSISYSQIADLQSLRYQYPNGFKLGISSSLKKELQGAHIAIPANNIILQKTFKINIRPGLLMLRCILELSKHKEDPCLSATEIGSFLLPITKNGDYENGVAAIRAFRQGRLKATNRTGQQNRNIRAWMRFLSSGNMFDLIGKKLVASPKLLEDAQAFRGYCSMLEKRGPEWAATGNVEKDSESWFEHYGSISFQEMSKFPWALNVTKGADDFFGGEDDQSEPAVPAGRDYSFSATAPTISGKDFSQESRADSAQKASPRSKASFDTNDLLLKLQAGITRRVEKSKLHDNIVDELAKRLKKAGARITTSADSADIVAAWPDGGFDIIEIKTVTPLNIQKAIRLAIGQVSEYAYRFKAHEGKAAQRWIGIDATLPSDIWQIDFLKELGIGLLCVENDKTTSFSPSSFKKLRDL